MKLSTSIHYLFRLLFCLSLMLLSYKNLKDNKMNKKKLSNNIDIMNRIMRKYKFQFKFTKFAQSNADALVLLPICLMILTAILSLLNLPMAKLLAFLAVVLHIVFIDNCFLDPHRKVVFKASIYFGLYGALSAY